MMMRRLVRNRNIIPTTHYFEYKGNQYPIKFDFFKYSSKYFEKNQDEIEKTKFIPLVDPMIEDKLNLTEDTILNFIRYSEGEEISIDLENVFGLSYLSNKYEVLSLSESVSEFIDDHHQELVIEILSNEINQANFQLETYENILSKHLSNYINDDRLFALPVPVLYHVLHNFNEMQNQGQIECEIETRQIIDLLFNCLDHHGKNASILFDVVDFGSENIGLINRLFNEYSETFDFSMISSSLAKVSLDLTNELVKHKEESSSIFKEMTETIDEQQKELDRLKEVEKENIKMIEKKEEDLRIEFSKQVQIIEEEYERRIKSIEQSFDKIIQKQEELNESSILQSYRRVVIDMLKIEQFRELSNESKLFIVKEIIEFFNENKNLDDEIYKNSSVQRILCCNRLFSLLSEKSSLLDLTLLEFIDINLAELRLKNEYIEFLFKNNYLMDIIDDDCLKYYDSFIFEIKYPSDSFGPLCNFVSNVKSKDDENSKKMKISLVIEAKDYFDKNYEINKIVDICIMKTAIEKVNENTFINLFNLSEIELCEGTTTIGNNSFNMFSHLKKISIPSSVTLIETNSFNECTSLETIEIPSTVNEIQDGSFNGCEKLSEVIVDPYRTKITSRSFDLNKLMFGPTVEKIESNEIFKQMQKITISNNVSSIEEKAFQGCTSLMQITMLSSVKLIGKYTFDKCSSLKQIVIPLSVSVIEEGAFNGCSSLEQIKIHHSVTSIGKYCFKNCESLKQIQIPFSIVSIEDETFCGCSSLEQVLIPSSINKIGNSSFKKCKSLAMISFPPTVLSIGEYCFDGCESLHKIEIDPYTTIIQPNSFDNCSKFDDFSVINKSKYSLENKSINLNDRNQMNKEEEDFNEEEMHMSSKNDIKDEETALYNKSINILDFSEADGDIKISILYLIKSTTPCKNNTQVQNLIAFLTYLIKEKQHSKMQNIKNKIIRIEKKELEEKVFINYDIVEIMSDKNAFDSCEFSSHIDNFSEFNFEIKYPSDNFNNIYQNVLKLKSSHEKIKISIFITEIKIIDNHFSKNENINFITLDSNIKSIDDNAFNGCTSLNEIKIPSSVTSIGSGAFNNCSSLIKISLPSSITIINDHLFSNCTSLKEIEIPSLVTSISKDAFFKCSSLTQIVISPSVEFIGEYAFQMCSSLQKIEISSSVKSIGGCAFSKCKKLTEVSLPSSITTINDHLFWQCSLLKEIIIPPSITSINKSAFNRCISLTKIIIPQSVTSIGEYVFQKCTSLVQIDIPSSVNSIGKYTFSLCSSLSDVSLSASLLSIEEKLFLSCSSLKEIIIPSSVTSINPTAFNKCTKLKKITIPSSINIDNIAIKSNPIITRI